MPFSTLAAMRSRLISGRGFRALQPTVDFFKQAASGTGLYTLYYDTSNGLTFAGVGGANALNVQGTWSPSIDTWYHLAVLRKCDTFTLYANGRGIGSETVPYTLPNVFDRAG